MSQRDDGQLLCPHRIEPVGPLDHFCPRCGKPITSHASMDPMGQISSTDGAYSQSISGRPRVSVLIGIWLSFAPQIPALLYGCATIISMWVRGAPLLLDSSATYIESSFQPDLFVMQAMALLVIAGVLAAYVAILRRVTARYLNREESDQATRRLEGDGKRAARSTASPSYSALRRK